MKLTDFFVQNRQSAQSVATQQSAIQQTSTVADRQIMALIPGQTIQGEVLSQNGNEVQLKLLEELIISAKMDQNIHLERGKLLSFEVKNNGQMLSLSPLFTNTATDANVLKALDMASLPVNSDTMAMTEAMMRAGLSIDRGALQQVFRETMLYPESTLADVIDLHRLNIPVNQESLTQVAAYRNLSHQLGSGLNQVAEELPEVLQGMLQKGNVEGAGKLWQEVLQLFSQQPESPGEIPQTQEAMGSLPQGTEGAEQGATVQELSDLLTAHKAQETEEAGSLMAQKTAAWGEKGEQPQPVTARQILSRVEEAFKQALQSGDRSLLRELLSNREITDFVKEQLREMWTLSPEEVAAGDKVEELYQRLGRQMKSLTQILENAGQTGTKAYQSATNLNQNLDFLQQLNQEFTYLQLPLRLQQGRDAHGELYVYTNKKHLASREGQITALLHLDMEHLGPLDVYVALQDQKVNTRFYVQDDGMLDFLAERMDLLTERLHKRGYDCQCEMRTREDAESAPGNVVERLLEQEPQIPLAQYAFDVRT